MKYIVFIFLTFFYADNVYAQELMSIKDAFCSFTQWSFQLNDSFIFIHEIVLLIIMGLPPFIMMFYFHEMRPVGDHRWWQWSLGYGIVMLVLYSVFEAPFMVQVRQCYTAL